MSPIVPRIVTSPKHLPEWFIPLPDNWQEAIVRMEKIGRLTNIKTGDVFLYEMTYGKRTWKIIGLEVILDETTVPTPIEEPEKDETLSALAEDG